MKESRFGVRKCLPPGRGKALKSLVKPCRAVALHSFPLELVGTQGDQIRSSRPPKFAKFVSTFLWSTTAIRSASRGHKNASCTTSKRLVASPLRGFLVSRRAMFLSSTLGQISAPGCRGPFHPARRVSCLGSGDEWIRQDDDLRCGAPCTPGPN